MSSMFRTALRAFSAIVVIRMCIGRSNDIGTQVKVHWYRFVNERMSFDIPVDNAYDTQWKEYISDQEGHIIMETGEIQNSPRMDRYEDTSSLTTSRLVVKNVTMSDGGYYYGHIKGREPNHQVHFHLLVIGNITCNETENHIGTLGENMTYLCAMTYQGRMFERLGVWGGPGVMENGTIQDESDRLMCLDSKYKTCYSGVVKFITTFPVTRSLDGTTRNFSLLAMNDTRQFSYRTGVLTVICARGMKGDQCNVSMTCADNPCEQNAPCNDTVNGNFLFKCGCTEQYAGVSCQVPIACSDVTCENYGTCYENGTGLFSCHCPEHYNGTFCQVAEEIPTVPFIMPTWTTQIDGRQFLDLKTTSDNLVRFLPYLLLLFIPLLIAVVITSVVVCRRRQMNDEDEDDEGSSSGSSGNDLSSESS